MAPVPYSRLLHRLSMAGLVAGPCPDAGPEVCDVTADSRTVTPGACFVAVRGTQLDGRAFVDDALRRGAAMVVSESLQPEHAGVHVPVTHAGEALALCAAAFYGEPSKALTCVGITGTNGKTSTAWLLYETLSKLNVQSGLLGTVQYAYGSARRHASLTTPPAPDLQRMLREMAAMQCRWCVMEVSSHALDQRRVHGMDFDVAVFTNLQHDHLDYHKTDTAYARAKKRLFDSLSPDAFAVVNADDPRADTLVHDCAATVVTYGQRRDADISFAICRSAPSRLSMRLDGQRCDTRLSGLFNAYNIAGAYGAAIAQGLPSAEVCDALAQADPPPGRFEPIRFEDGALAIVDYAHTPDALEQALRAARTCAPHALLWCVFGCGGDRDRAKRPLMGAIAERYADYVIITSDNTRSESYDAISDDIVQGMAHPDEALWIEDRREAIGYAAGRSREGDVVLIAGKGHERFQDRGDEIVPLSDRELVIEAFAPRVHIN